MQITFRQAKIIDLNQIMNIENAGFSKAEATASRCS